MWVKVREHPALCLHFSCISLAFRAMCYGSIPKLSFLQQKCPMAGPRLLGFWMARTGRWRLVEITDRRTVEQQVPGVPRRVTDAN